MLVLQVESGEHNYNRIIFTAHNLGVRPTCGRGQGSLINGHVVTSICTVSVQQLASYLACESPLKTSLHKYFKRALPTSEETGLGEATTRTVNGSVQRVLTVARKVRRSQERNERSIVIQTGQPSASMPQRTGILVPRSISRKSSLNLARARYALSSRSTCLW